MIYAFLRKALEGNNGEYNVVRIGAETQNQLNDKIDQYRSAGYVASDYESWEAQLKLSPDFQSGAPKTE